MSLRLSRRISNWSRFDLSSSSLEPATITARGLYDLNVQAIPTCWKSFFIPTARFAACACKLQIICSLRNDH